MTKKKIDRKYADLKKSLGIDCAQCSGLCCVALYCMKTDGFPENKEAGTPCKYLTPDFRCDIYTTLETNHMKGCLAYDCFGAGQKVTQSCYPNEDWKTDPEKANEIFRVFTIVFQLHQMAWYLLEALSLVEDEQIKAEIDELIAINMEMTEAEPREILLMDIDGYRASVNRILKHICGKSMPFSSESLNNKDYLGKIFGRANLDNIDFSMALMIAVDLEGCSLQKTNFLGADIRDANIKNTDLSGSIFLTQMQVNAAKGNTNTKLPPDLSHPAHWRGFDDMP